MSVYPTCLVPTIQGILPALCGGRAPLLSEPEALELIRLERLRAGAAHPVRYVLAGPPDRPVGMLPVYPVTAPFGPREDPSTWFGQRPPGGTPWRTGCHLGSPGTVPAVIPVSHQVDADAVRAQLVLAARGELRPAGNLDFVCLPLLDDDLLRSVAPLVAPQESMVAESHEAFVEIDSDSFDGYLRSQAPDRRKKVRKEIRRFHASGLRMVRVDLRRQYVRLAPLLRNVEAKYGRPESLESYETYLLSLGMGMGERAICLAAYDGDDPVAFTVVGDQGPVWRLRGWGCDYQRTAGTYAYFYLSCYEPLRLAAESGAARLILGAGTLAAKVERGARLRRLTTVAVPAARSAPAHPPPAGERPRHGLAAGVDISVRHTVRGVHPGEGDPLLADQQLRELGRVERVWRGLGVRPWYVVAERAGRTVALVPGYPALGRHYLGWRAGDLFPAGRSGRWRRGVLIGSDLTFSSAIAAGGRPEVAAALVREALAQAALDRPDHICLPHLHDDQYDVLRAAAPPADRVISESGDAVLDLTFDSFEAYVRRLPSRRTAVRRERRRFLAADLSLRAIPLAEVASELAGLLAKLENKYGTVATTPEDERRYLLGAAAAMGDAGTALVVYDGGRMVAGSVLWDLGAEWRVRCWGCDLDHPAVRRDYLYFNLMYYEPMLRARAAGARRLLLGTGSLETKTLRGARIHRRRSVAWEVGDHGRS